MKRFIKILVYVFVVFIFLISVSAAGVYYWAAKDLPKIEKITDYNPPLATTVYSKNDQVLGYLAKEKRFLRSLEEMSPFVPKAFLAAEDSGFYQHKGVDLFGIFRAAVKNIKAGAIVQGGSTITQQVIKSLLLNPRRSYKRKLREAILAYRLENNLTKDEILTIYLNQIYLGAGAYGVESASRMYFAKHISELNLAEAAVLAGLPKAPSLYSPYHNPDKAKKRQKYVLDQMVDLDWITEQQYEQALDYELNYTSMLDPSWGIGAYYLEEIRRWLIDRFGEERTYTGGLHIYTAVDLKHQKLAEKALQKGLVASTKRRGWKGPIKHLKESEFDSFLEQEPLPQKQLKIGKWKKVLVKEVKKNGAWIVYGNSTGWIDVESMAWCRTPDPSKAPEEVPDIHDAREVLNKGDVVWASLQERSEDKSKPLRFELEQKPQVEGALVSIDPKTGEVRALVGGFSFERSQFNRATQAKRQVGSTFKPIVYSAALDNGFTAASVLLDAPIVYTNRSTNSTWKPENYERVSFGSTLLRTALVKSRNLVTIRVARQIGIDTVIKRAKALGLRAEFPHDLSVSLGSASVRLLNLCEAFSAFARNGSIVEPRLVLRITDSWGDEIYVSQKESKKVISSRTAYIITYLMQQVVKQGTGWRVKELGRSVAGKTGTTDEQKDAWFMGFAPYLLTGVYVGFDEPKPMGKYETGSRAAAPIWLDYRQSVEKNYPVQDFNRPPGIVMSRIDAQNGLLAGTGTEKSFLLPFKAGTQPSKISPAGKDDKRFFDSNGTKKSQDDILKQIF